MYSLVIALVAILLVIILVFSTLKFGSHAFSPVNPEQRTKRLKALKTAMDIELSK
jgi:hypothetical protein